MELHYNRVTNTFRHLRLPIKSASSPKCYLL